MGEMGDWGRRFPRAHIYFYCFLMRRAAEEVFFSVVVRLHSVLGRTRLLNNEFSGIIYTHREREMEREGETQTHTPHNDTHTVMYSYM